MNEPFVFSERPHLTIFFLAIISTILLSTLPFRVQGASILPFSERADRIQLKYVKVQWTDKEFCSKHGNGSCTFHIEFARCEYNERDCDSAFSLIDLSSICPDGCAKCPAAGVMTRCNLTMDTEACELKTIGGVGMDVRMTVLDAAGNEVASGKAQFGRGTYIGTLPCKPGNTASGRPYPCINIDYMIEQAPGKSGVDHALVGQMDDE